MEKAPIRTFRNLLVTGGCGFIGSAFIRYLLETETFAGIIINVDAMASGANPLNLQTVQKDPRYRFYELNICKRKELADICDQHKIDTIVHFAAESHVDRSIHGPDAFIESNILGTFHLLEIVRNRPHIHFHHISTDEVFGSIEAPGLFHEQTAYHPNSPYSASKAASDHLVRAWAHTYNISYTLSNCSNNYGPYQHPEKLIPHMIHCCLSDLKLPIYGTGANVRDWIHVDDHVRAIVEILKKAPSGSSYNVGTRSECDNLTLVKNLATEVARQLNLPLDTFTSRIQFVQDRKGHDARYAIDPTKLENELHFKPTYSFETGLQQTIAWYLAHRDWLLAHGAVGIQTQK